jgi:prepilin-type N-terminal cleavage/methylation domain-containing protein
MHQKPPQPGARAFSLPEMLVTVAVIGILAGIAVPVVSNLVPSSRLETARRNLNLLNGAVVAFNQASHELSLEASGDSTDALAIIRSLQYAAPSGSVNFTPGAPFFDPLAAVEVTSSDDSYRARWNGRVFVLLEPGVAGSGVDLLRLAGKASSAPTFGADYKPVGAR